MRLVGIGLLILLLVFNPLLLTFIRPERKMTAGSVVIILFGDALLLFLSLVFFLVRQEIMVQVSTGK